MSITAFSREERITLFWTCPSSCHVGTHIGTKSVRSLILQMILSISEYNILISAHSIYLCTAMTVLSSTLNSVFHEESYHVGHKYDMKSYFFSLWMRSSKHFFQGEEFWVYWLSVEVLRMHFWYTSLVACSSSSKLKIFILPAVLCLQDTNCCESRSFFISSLYQFCHLYFFCICGWPTRWYVI
jgi:hypothetical protein